MGAGVMRKLRIGVLLLLAMVAFEGCSTVHPLKFDYYSRNLVLGKDSVLTIDDQPIDPANLRQELVNRTINEDTSILLHVHQSVSPETFDAVVKSLRVEGFRNLRFRVFSD
jgi:hypothetical protein